MKKQIVAVLFAMAFFVNCKADYPEFEDGLKNLNQDFYNIYCSYQDTQDIFERTLIQYFNSDNFHNNLACIYTNFGYISADTLIEIKLSSFGINSQEKLVDFLLKILTHNLKLLLNDASYSYSYSALTSLRSFCNYIEAYYLKIARNYEKDYSNLDELLENAKYLENHINGRVGCRECLTITGIAAAFVAGLVGIGAYYS